MKKFVAALLCLIMALSLISCKGQNDGSKLPDTDSSTENGANDNGNSNNNNNDNNNEENGASDDTDPEKPLSTPEYYKIVQISPNESEYHIYDLWGNEVLVEVTDKPLSISMIDQSEIEIRVGMGTGTSMSKYYDIQNDRFSEEFLCVVAASGNLLAYVDAPQDDNATKGTLVVRDIFDKNEFFKTFLLDFSPREVMPISKAEFTEREMALELVYLNQSSNEDESVTLPVRTSTFDQNAFTKADKAIFEYEQVLNGNEQVYDVLCESCFYLKDVRSPYSMIPLQSEASMRYAYTDMDKNGVCELVIDCGDTLILRYYAGTVYLYSFIFRNLYYLQTDGSHSWNHNGSDFEYGETQLYFEGINVKYRDLWRIVNDGEPDAKYYIGSRAVSLVELQKYLEENPKSRIKFSPLVIPWQNKTSHMEAIAIAEDYWKEFDIEENGYLVKHAVNRWAPDSVYVMVIQRYVIDHYSTFDEIWIDKTTGETIIPFALDGKG